LFVNKEETQDVDVVKNEKGKYKGQRTDSRGQKSAYR
jgi:hypothetical protein